MVNNRSFYEILGVEADCNEVDIKKAYKAKLLSTHPDKVGKDVGNKVLIEEIKEAYRVLIESPSREKYDKELAESYKKQGFHNAGEGLEDYSLDAFDFDTNDFTFRMSCPRCHTADGFEFTEDVLEEHCMERSLGGFYVVVQCGACSLWLNVNFEVVDDDES